LKKSLETTKLFYDRYLYKVSVKNSLSSIFRDKNLSFAKHELGKLQYQHDNENYPLNLVKGLRQVHISYEDFFHAKFLLNEFEKQSDYKLRVEYPTIRIYSNDEIWISKLENASMDVIDIYRPKNINVLTKNTILIDDFPYEFKITLRDRVDPMFANWVKVNRDKIKIGDKALECVETNGYCRGFYFFIKNEKILQLVNLMINGSIARIDKIISNAVIDK